MKTSFTTIILKDKDKNATGIQVPSEVVEALGKGKKPPVKVTLNDYSYRTTIAVMGGIFMLSLSAENREAAGVKAGDEVEVMLELDTEPRIVAIPQDLAEVLSQEPARKAAFDALSHSVRKEYVRQVEEAKTAETRNRRIAGIVAKLGDS